MEGLGHGDVDPGEAIPGGGKHDLDADYRAQEKAREIIEFEAEREANRQVEWERADGSRRSGKPPRRPRAVKDRSSKPMVKGPGYEVKRYHLDGFTYVLIYTVCGKNCSVCSPTGARFDRDRPGHGPYWYRMCGKLSGEGPRAGKQRMEYIGSKLVFEKEDRDALKARRAANRRAFEEAKEASRHGQSEASVPAQGQSSTSGQGAPSPRPDGG